MAFRARIVEVSQSGRQANITILFFTTSPDPPWEHQHTINVQQADTMTAATINAEIAARGAEYKAALNRVGIVRANIGTETTI